MKQRISNALLCYIFTYNNVNIKSTNITLLDIFVDKNKNTFDLILTKTKWRFCQKTIKKFKYVDKMNNEFRWEQFPVSSNEGAMKPQQVVL